MYLIHKGPFCRCERHWTNPYLRTRDVEQSLIQFIYKGPFYQCEKREKTHIADERREIELYQRRWQTWNRALFYYARPRLLCAEIADSDFVVSFVKKAIFLKSSTQKPCLSAKQLCASAKERYISAKERLSPKCVCHIVLWLIHNIIVRDTNTDSVRTFLSGTRSRCW